MKVEIRVQPSLPYFSFPLCIIVLTLPGSASSMKMEARRWFQQHSVGLSSRGTLGIFVERFGDFVGVVPMHEIVPPKI